MSAAAGAAPGGVMLSRVAESIYWLGRYVERAEDAARIVNVTAHLALDLPRGLSPDWKPLVDSFGLWPEFESRYSDRSERNVVRFLVGETDNASSLLSSLVLARECARTIRDFLPREGWELLNELFLYAKGNLGAGVSKSGRYAYLQHIIGSLHALAGLLDSCMNHDLGHAFLAMGRHIERADMTTRIVDVRSSTLLPGEDPELRSYENIQWVSVLKSLTAYQMYRRAMQVRVRRADALVFLVQSEVFPRAVLHCLGRVDASLELLPAAGDARRVLARVRRVVQTADMAALTDAPQELHDFLDGLQVGLAHTSDEIARAYFALPDAQAQAQTQVGPA